MRSTPLRRTLVAGVLGVTASLTLGTGIAGAATGDAGQESGARHRARLTAEQRQCLKDQGVTRPEGRPTKDDIKKLRAAAKECDIKLPKRFGRHHRPRLTAEQRQCLKDQGVTRPDGRPTQADIDKLKAAAEECGITLRHHGNRPVLTDEQRSCLEESGLTRPEGRPTAEQREAFRAAAEACGIELPERPGAGASTDAENTAI